MEFLDKLAINEEKYLLAEKDVEAFLKEFMLKYPSFHMNQNVLNDELVSQFKTRFPELIKHQIYLQNLEI